MGMCLPCFGSSSEDYDQPDPEVRRQQQAEAALKRQKQEEARGLKDPEAYKQKQKRLAEMEKQENAQGPPGESGLKWTVDG